LFKQYSCPHGAQQQTRNTPLLQSNDNAKKINSSEMLSAFTSRAKHLAEHQSLNEHCMKRSFNTATEQYYNHLTASFPGQPG